MFVAHLSLGGCLKAPPVQYGITADTGGHIAYILEAATATAVRDDVDQVTILTRLFEDDDLDPIHAQACEVLGPKLSIERIATEDRRYREKEALAADLPAFTAALIRYFVASPRRPDVIHAHFADAAAVAIVVRRKLGIPFVYTPHALGIDKQRHARPSAALDLRIEAEREAIGQADALIVSTLDEAERQVGAYGLRDVGARVRRVPPGVPRAAPHRPVGETAERPILLSIARPVAKKNLRALVRAYLATPALVDRADLVILAGQHESRLTDEEARVVEELRALAADPRARGRVSLPSRHDAEDVAALYARAAVGGVFVNPALHEPFGLTLLEAAAAGVPVVATRNGGPAEIVAEIGHGLLVDPLDEDGIAAACLSLLDDPERYCAMAAAGRANVSRYDWDRYADATLAVYRAVAAPPKPRLLASDIDGTLTGCGDGARAFRAWRTTHTVPFVVATGRSFREARAVLRAWRLPLPDAFITDVGTRIMLPHGTGWRECAEYAGLLDASWDRGAIERALAGLGLTPQPSETWGPHKLSYFGSRRDADRIEAALRSADCAARVVFSHGRLIDVLAPAGGKAAAVAFYAGRLGLTLADCAAAGDSGNDRTILEACGTAIVVGNADEDLAALTPRPGLLRAAALHAAGVMEGLRHAGLAPDLGAAAAA